MKVLNIEHMKEEFFGARMYLTALPAKSPEAEYERKQALWAISELERLMNANAVEFPEKEETV